MVLKIQIYSFFVSFVYGIIFYLLLELNSKFVYSSNLFIKIIFSSFFVLFNCLLYFIILLFVNNGYIHFYFFICLILGYLMCKVIYKKIVKRNLK